MQNFPLRVFKDHEMENLRMLFDLRMITRRNLDTQVLSTRLSVCTLVKQNMKDEERGSFRRHR
jgi:hypothetical protein